MHRLLKTVVSTAFAASLMAAASPDAIGQTDQSDTAAPAPSINRSEVELSQTLSKPEPLEIGDPITLELTVTHPKASEIKVPRTFEKTRWSLTKTSRQVEKSPESPLQTTTIDLVFQIFYTGESTLPSFPLQLLSKAETGDQTELKTEPVTVRVASGLSADSDLSFYSLSNPFRLWQRNDLLVWASALGGLFIAALLGFMLARRETREDSTDEPTRPADVIALEKLENLSVEKLIEAEEYEKLYFGISFIVREYLGRRFGFPGAELTTTEITGYLDKLEWSFDLPRQKLGEWLRFCDRVKFSDFSPSDEQAEGSVETAYQIVEATSPEPQAPEDEEESESSGDSSQNPPEGTDRDARTDSETKPDANAESESRPSVESEEPKATNPETTEEDGQ